MLTGIDQEYATRFMLPGIDQGMVMKPFALTLLNEYLITNLHKNVMLVFCHQHKAGVFFPSYNNIQTILFFSKF